MDISGGHKTLTSLLIIVCWNFETACTMLPLIKFEKKVNVTGRVKRDTAQIWWSEKLSDISDIFCRDYYHCHRIIRSMLCFSKISFASFNVYYCKVLLIMYHFQNIICSNDYNNIVARKMNVNIADGLYLDFLYRFPVWQWRGNLLLIKSHPRHRNFTLINIIDIFSDFVHVVLFLRRLK